ncbi:transporter substrate-binding domain-containing protein [Pseudomonas kuykendallii]|uniref:substrate-binding periplasmic protein n=1 Tax=Pseudomonas kuykendallii TaxID=1007099 RepID=UPI0028D441CF|nr:transporter substrate-binding domain-containing protein [Pseudomonas kuykendallii]
MAKRICWALLFCTACVVAQADPLRIVSEAWAPYVYEENGVVRGLDYELTATVLERLGITHELQLLPWKRSLAEFDEGRADAILDIFRNPDREQSMVFIDEPLSSSEFVLFYARQRPFPYSDLNSLKGLRIGVSPGYWYSNEAFRQSKDFIRENAPNHAANFGKLMLGRVDMVLIERRVGLYLAQQMGILDQLDYHRQLISHDDLYLALRRTPEFERLAARFTVELRRLKAERAATPAR